MAQVVASDSSDMTAKPSMDRLTHAVLKETSKSLKYYMDVKRRENAFVLNTNSSVRDFVPKKARFIHETNKAQSLLDSSYYADKDTKSTASNVQQKQKQVNTTYPNPEKQMCREELNFHMRSYNFSLKETSKFSDLRLRPTTRSTSLCTANRTIRSRSANKLPRHEHDQLIDNTADILASMVKSRRSLYQANLVTEQTAPIQLARSCNPSVLETNLDISNHSTIQSSTTHPTRVTSTKTDSLIKAIRQKSKPINKGLLCEYKISVTTGNCNGASTTAPIRIKLYGTNGHTTFHVLAHSETHHVAFLKGQTDVFILQTYHVDELIGITIGHDRKDMKASWFLNKISIDDPIRHVSYHIPCNAWLSIKSNDQKTMRDFPVVSTVAHQEEIGSNDHQEENKSQSEHSIVSTTGTISSYKSNLSKTNLFTNHKQVRNHRKQQRISRGATTVAEKSSLVSTNRSTLSQSSPPPIATEIHSNRDEVLSSLLAPVRRRRSPILSATSSDTDIEDNIGNQSRSTTPSPTLNQTPLESITEQDALQTKPSHDMFQRYSINYDRPPTRLEQRRSPSSVSSERSHKNKGTGEK